MEKLTKSVEQDLLSAAEKGNFPEFQRIASAISSLELKQWLLGIDLICTALIKKQKQLALFFIHLDLRISKRSINTALHTAVVHSDFEIIHLLVQKGISFKTRDSEQMTPFLLLAQRFPFDEESVRILNYFLYEGADIKYKDERKGYSLLHHAAQNGNLALMRIILRDLSLLNFRSKSVRLTPLHVAALNSQSEAVSLLLEFGASHNLTDGHGRIPLDCAAFNGDVQTIQILLECTLKQRNFKNFELLMYCAAATGNQILAEEALRQTAVNEYYSTGKTPLHIAVEKGFEEIVEFLLKQGANPNVLQEKVEDAEQNLTSWPSSTALHIAAEKGNERIFSLLLKYNAFPTITDNGGQTPLHSAARSGSFPIVQLLLNRGSPANSTAKNGLTPLHLAAHKGHREIVQLLLQFGADPAAILENSIETPLLLASETGNSEIVEIIAKTYSTDKSKQLKFYPALFMASYHGFENVVKVLLQNKADPNVRLDYCFPPLHIAAQEAHPGVVKLLLEHGADPKVKLVSVPEYRPKSPRHIGKIFIHGDFKESQVQCRGPKVGFTPLHHAAKAGVLTIVEMLLNSGAEINAISSSRKLTPLSVAVEAGHERIVELLLRAGADPTVKENNLPPLIFAIMRRNVPIIDLFLQFTTVNFKFDFNVDDYTSRHIPNYQKGYTPLHAAVLKSSVEIVEMLLKKKALVNEHSEQDFPLHCAIKRGDASIADKLLKYGARTDSISKEGDTLLIHAIKKNQVAIFKSLLRKGVLFESMNTIGQFVLDIGLDRFQNKEMIEFLLNCGATTTATDINSKIHFNVLFKYFDNDLLLQRLLEAGCDPNAWCSTRNFTILHAAAHSEKANAVETLLLFGADVNSVSITGKTPLSYIVARRPGNILDKTPDKHIIRSLVKQIAKLKYEKKDINEDNQKLICHRYMQPYYLTCQAELDRMMQTPVIKGVSYFDILRADERRMASYARNSDISVSVLYEQILNYFPQYGQFLQNRFQRGLKRKKLLESNLGFYKKAVGFDIPIVAGYEIFSYLRICDLQNLHVAHKNCRILEEDF